MHNYQHFHFLIKQKELWLSACMKTAVSIGNMDGSDKKKFTSFDFFSWELTFPLVM